MRRMREHFWIIALILFPLVGLGFFLKGAFYDPSPLRAPAAKEVEGNLEMKRGAKPQTVASDQATETEEVEGVEEVSEPVAEPVNLEARQPASTNKAECVYMDFNGDGPVATKVTTSQWKWVMSQFHEAKDDLEKWLKTNRSSIPEWTATVMENRVRNLRIQRPPSLEEPDLTWRGVGVYTYDTQKTPILRIGSGLVKLALTHPERSRFELARLVAQAWSPCELKKADAGEPWSKLLSCLKIDASKECATGGYAESGWAVSSLLASEISRGGCKLPALSDGSVSACLKELTFAMSTPNWKVASQ